MKKLLFLIVLILITTAVSSQALKKGNLIGVHVLTVQLKPGVTMEQFKDFYINNYLHEMNKIDPNWQAYMAEGIRGENANQIGIFHVIKSAKDREKYINQDGSRTQLSTDAQEKLRPVRDKLNELGTYKTTLTDWLIN